MAHSLLALRYLSHIYNIKRYVIQEQKNLFLSLPIISIQSIPYVLSYFLAKLDVMQTTSNINRIFIPSKKTSLSLYLSIHKRRKGNDYVSYGRS